MHFCVEKFTRYLVVSALISPCRQLTTVRPIVAIYNQSLIVSNIGTE
jgi:hypothetical protein